YPNRLVGLMNVGAEETKGNNFSKEVFNLLGEHDVNFIGNIEGRDLFSGRCEVIVCDGFIGNVVLKVAEGTAGVLKKFLKQVLTKNPIRRLGALLSLGAYRDLREIADHEEYGGAPLLGVNGTCIIGHGSSSSKAVENAIRVAKDFIACDVNRHIVEVLKTFSGEEDQR
ncbi:phosphate acyltransferase PlsX, partial [PVC group bacterium]|nr:phosphate acyltransferase PlsX [PVC group bacterium]